MKEEIIRMLEEMAAYAERHTNGNVCGYDLEHARYMIEAIKEWRP